MTDMEAKITITVDPAGKMHRVEVEGSTISIIRTLEPYLTAWLNTVNDCRNSDLSDTKVDHRLLDTVACRIIDTYGNPYFFQLYLLLLVNTEVKQHDRYGSKRAELEALAADNPGCLTVPAVAKFLDLKPDRVQDWLESANCPIKAIVYPPKCRKRPRREMRLREHATAGCTTGFQRSPFTTGF